MGIQWVRRFFLYLLWGVADVCACFFRRLGVFFVFIFYFSLVNRPMTRALWEVCVLCYCCCFVLF